METCMETGVASPPSRKLGRLLMTADIGGTHGQVQLWEQCDSDATGTREIMRTTLVPGMFNGLLELLAAALLEAARVLGCDAVVPSYGVLGCAALCEKMGDALNQTTFHAGAFQAQPCPRSMPGM